MAQMTIRPSTKLLMAWAVMEMVLTLAVAYVAMNYDARLWWLLAIPFFMGVLSAFSFVQRRSHVIHVGDGRLRFESGIASKTTRTLELEKIQDVRVDQTLGQRLLGVGSITVVTASETGSLTMAEIDRPQRVADEILNLARSAPRRF